MPEGKKKVECRTFLPPYIVEKLDSMVDNGIYSSRSEAIYDILKDAIGKKPWRETG